MIPARASESTATAKLDPGGTVTRTLRVFDEPHAAASPVTTRMLAWASRAVVARCLTTSARKRERMLKQYRGGHGVDVPLSASG